jgi:hypothetical protein
MIRETILWERLDRPGHECARLRNHGSGFVLEGSAVFEEEGLPVRCDYQIVTDHRFHTATARVSGWLGGRELDLRIETEEGRWLLNGTESPEVAGAVDLDLNFSPSTNLLPIRRLALGIGKEAAVRAAWLRFPSFDLEPLEQTYLRIAPQRYRYRSEGGFEAELEVRPSGLVAHYPGLARARSFS